MPDKIILVGGGGHCKACIDVIEQEKKFIIHGILDKHLHSGVICGYTVLGNDDLFESLIRDNYHFLITMGHIKDPSPRSKIFLLLKYMSAHLPAIKSPFAMVSRHSTISEGSIIMHHSLVNTNAEIGKNCIINSKALVEHDSVIGDNTHISTGAIVNGNCKIGKNSFIGSNAVISNGITIGDNVVVGTGAVVVNDILTEGTYVGNPARKIIR